MALTFIQIKVGDGSQRVLPELYALFSCFVDTPVFLDAALARFEERGHYLAKWSGDSQLKHP